MVKLILCSHGPFAQAMLDSAQMIIGPQENIVAFGLNPGDDLDVYKENVERSILEAAEQKENVLLFTDIFSGTPFNTAIALMQKYPYLRHYSGINMPILLEIASSRDIMSFDELCSEVKQMSKDSIVDVNELIEKLNSCSETEE
ncbi:MAG: PTS sugar transporter subunit IIA [Oscillospiraceae bacterium]|nr:PTS sugar transporter subunit IIA [Oscillospiraceae bacterium]